MIATILIPIAVWTQFPPSCGHDLNAALQKWTPAATPQYTSSPNPVSPVYSGPATDSASHPLPYDASSNAWPTCYPGNCYASDQLSSSEHLVGNIELPPPEKVVLRETTLSEKYGLGVESTVRPDKEIEALKAEATTVRPSFDLQDRAYKTGWEMPTMQENRQYKMQWDKQFTVSWDDDDGGFSLGGKHFTAQRDCYSGERFLFDYGCYR